MNVFKFPINNFSPVDEQIYIHLKNIIRNKEFENIKIFPTPRDLAIQIKQSYSDVMSAYRQLEVEGYLKKQDDIFIVPHFERVDKEHSSGYKSDYVIDEEVAIFDFSPTTVDKQYFPLSRWQECLLESSNLSSLFQFSHPDGEYLLREAICTHLKKNRNIEASPANIFISSNVPALLLQLGTFLKKGGYYNSFKIENPGNYEAFFIFKELDYHLSTCPVSLEDGHDVNSLKDERTLFYVTLSYQQPLGYNLPIEKRAKLHQWAKKMIVYLLRMIVKQPFGMMFAMFIQWLLSIVHMLFTLTHSLTLFYHRLKLLIWFFLTNSLRNIHSSQNISLKTPPYSPNSYRTFY